MYDWFQVRQPSDEMGRDITFLTDVYTSLGWMAGTIEGCSLSTWHRMHFMYHPVPHNGIYNFHTLSREGIVLSYKFDRAANTGCTMCRNVQSAVAFYPCQLESFCHLFTTFPAGGSSCSDQLTMLITIADSCWTKLKCCGTDPIAVDTVESRQYNFYTVMGAMISRW